MSSAPRTRAEAEAERAHEREHGPPPRHELRRNHNLWDCTCGSWYGDTLAAGALHLAESRALARAQSDG
jgi:hypothetical protein